MINLSLPADFRWPDRPWAYTREDVAQAVRAVGITDHKDVENEIEGHSQAEWVLVKRLARTLNATVSLSEEQWAEIIDELHCRHIKHWGRLDQKGGSAT